MSKDELQEVLDWVNRVRAAVDLRPVSKLQKGIPKSQNKCALANTLRGSGYTAQALITYRGVNLRRKFSSGPSIAVTIPGYQIPWYVVDFIENFDALRFPELIMGQRKTDRD